MGQRATGEPLQEDAVDETPDEESSLPKDEIFDLVSNHRRRYVIHYCKQADGPVPLSDLAEQVAAWEHDKEIRALTSAERKTVYTSLQQTHLPRLDRAGVIEFEGGTVALTEKADRLNIYLDIVPENSISWGMYYLGLSAFACLVVAALWLELLPTGSIPALVYPTLVVVVFAASSAYHAYTNRRYRFENLERPP
ncbi:DUF7344 domain-containing protein [Halobellus rufus]|uniref:DUF7344 domain-containing protein n=1 Tax=Halobellus rufus TaxID=1448860 RepID=UPI00067869CB|nr:hypothetical protein [Halobellus rufus]